MLNKYDKAVPKDWSWQTMVPQLPTLDVKGFDDVLAQQQSQVDQIGLLSDKKPNVLNNQADLEVYQGYKADVDKALEHVSQEYGKGATAGQLAYKNYLNQFRKDWSPGGRADLLNKRSEQYQTGLKAIDEFYAKDASPVNKTLAKKQLQDQLANPINLDPATGKYTSISTPELYQNPDVNKAVDEMLKEIKANGDTQFLGDENKSWWLKKIQTETREPERIKLAYQALSQQPEYASQIDRDTQYKALQTDPKKYQQAYEAKQNQAIDQLTKTAESAKSSEASTKQWQDHLRDNGFNIDNDGKWGSGTEKATQEYLANQKKQVQDNVSGFDLNSQLKNEVNNSYLGYALRGAYEKKDMDLVFNQAKKAMLEDSRKREENKINRDRLNYEYAAKDQSQILAVDGIAVQLPEMQKQYEDLKSQRDGFKTKTDDLLKKSTTFNGWDMGNVGQAYLKWQKVQGNTEAEKKANYKALLNQDASHPFSDDQVEQIYQEMNVPDGALKSTLTAYNQMQTEVSRFEEGQSQIASQYVNTPEGKKAVANLRKEAPENLRNLSDQELIDESISSPEKFEVYSYNPLGASIKNSRNSAKDFQNKMGSDVKTQAKNGMSYEWGVLGTTEIYAGTKDTTLKPIYDMTKQAIENGSGNNFSTFGLTGLRFKDNKGNDLDQGEAKKVNQVAVTKDQNGNPILKVGVTVTKKDGKTKDGYTEISLVPGSSMAREVESGLTNAYIAKMNSGEKVAAQGLLDNLEAIQGKNGFTEAAIDVQVKGLKFNNTFDEGLMTINKAGEVVPISSLGWKSKNLGYDESIDGRDYETHGIIMKDGSTKVADIIVDPATGAKVLVPSLDGSTTYRSASGVTKNRTGKKILSQANVIVNKTKE